jgi:hypothetical protein
MIPFGVNLANHFLQNQSLACLIRFTSKPNLSKLNLVFAFRSLRFVKNAFAERGGFEPPLHYCKHAFQACAFSHSATSPMVKKNPARFSADGRQRYEYVRGVNLLLHKFDSARITFTLNTHKINSAG